MMNRNIPLTVLFVLMQIPVQMYGQTISGRISDSITGMGIGYATIALKGSSVGAYSDSAGNFSLPIPDGYLADSMVVSSIGYEHLTIPYDTNSVNISLKPIVYSLREVTITNKQRENKIGAFRLQRNQAIPIYKGGILAVLFETSLKQVMISLVSFNISNICNKNAKLRLRIFSCDTFSLVPKTVHSITLEPIGYSILPMPAIDLLTDQVVIGNLKKGWNTIDLSEYKVSVSSCKFYVALEPVECIGCFDGSNGSGILNKSDIKLACSKDKGTRFKAAKFFDTYWMGGESTNLFPLINITLNDINTGNSFFKQ